MDCGIPIPPNNGSILKYSGTKLGDFVIFNCNEGFRPSGEVNGTCISNAMWNPASESHNCTLIEGMINLLSQKCGKL